jgi:hypothetical protein
VKIVAQTYRTWRGTAGHAIDYLLHFYTRAHKYTLHTVALHSPESVVRVPRCRGVVESEPLLNRAGALLSRGSVEQGLCISVLFSIVYIEEVIEFYL